MFAATCGLLAALGHALMSATALPWWTLAAAFAAAGAAGWLLAARERGLACVTSVAVAVQTLLHCGFSLAQAAAHAPGPGGAPLARQWIRYLLCGAQAPAAGAAPVPSPLPDLAGTADMAGMAGMASGSGVHAHHAAPATAAAAASAGHDMAGASPGGMLAAHLLAALLCGLWLAYGERGAFRLLRAGAGRLLAPLRLVLRLPAPPDRPRVRRRREHQAHPLRRLLLGHAVTSRGPPPGTAVL